MARPDRLLVSLWHPRGLSPLEDSAGPLQQRLLPLMNHRRVNPEPVPQLRYRPLPLQRLKCHLRLELGLVLLSFRHP